MAPRCSRCDAPIENTDKGYKRKSLLSVLTRRSAQVLFPHLNPADAFLCYGCVTAVTRKTRRCGRRRVYVEPVPTQQLRNTTGPNDHDYASQQPPPASRTPAGPAQLRPRGRPRLCGLMQKKNLMSNLRRLQQVGGFQEALIRVCSKIVCSEVRRF